MKISRLGLTAVVKKNCTKKRAARAASSFLRQSTNQIIDPKTSELYPREAKQPLFFSPNQVP